MFSVNGLRGVHKNFGTNSKMVLTHNLDPDYPNSNPLFTPSMFYLSQKSLSSSFVIPRK